MTPNPFGRLSGGPACYNHWGHDPLSLDRSAAANPQRATQLIDDGSRTEEAQGPFTYTTAGGDRYRVYNVAVVKGKILRTDTRRKLEATHRVFVAADGAKKYAAFTDAPSRWGTVAILAGQLRDAREAP